MKKLILILTIGLFYSSIQAQTDKQDLDQFEIKIRTTKDKIILKCNNGSSWTKLKFPKPDHAQLIDEHGMTKLESVKNITQKSDKELSDYMFSIKLENDKVILKGLQGTAWKELTYDCKNKNCTSTINELGMK